MRNKKYHVVFKLWTGSWYMDGTKCYDRTVEVRSNSIRYINSVMFKNFSEIDILCGKVDTFDMNGNFDKDTEDCN